MTVSGFPSRTTSSPPVKEEPPPTASPGAAAATGGPAEPKPSASGTVAGAEAPAATAKDGAALPAGTMATAGLQPQASSYTEAEAKEPVSQSGLNVGKPKASRARGGLFKPPPAPKSAARTAVDTAIDPVKREKSFESDPQVQSESHERSGKLGTVTNETKSSQELKLKGNNRGEYSASLTKQNESSTTSRIGGLGQSTEAGVQAGVNLQKGEASVLGQYSSTSTASSFDPGNLKAGEREKSHEAKGGVVLGPSGLEAQGGYQHTSKTTEEKPRAGGGTEASGTESSAGVKLQVGAAGVTASGSYNVSWSKGDKEAQTKDGIAVSGSVKIDKEGNVTGGKGSVALSRTDAAGGKGSVALSGGVTREQGKVAFEPVGGTAAGAEQYKMTVSDSFGVEAGVGVGQAGKGGSSLGVGFGLGLSTAASLERTVSAGQKGQIENGTVKPSVPAPETVSDPTGVRLTLQKGDVATYRFEGSLSVTVPVKAGPVTAGVSATVSGAMETQVENLGSGQVRLRVTPSDQAKVTASASAGFGAVKAGVEATSASALAQEFVFDLETKPGREAYAKAMKGELPSGFGDGQMQGDAGEVARRMAEGASSAVGYRPTLVAQVELKSASASKELLGFGTSVTATTQSSREVSFERDKDGKLLGVHVDDAELKAREKGSNSIWEGRRAETSSAEMLVRTSSGAAGGAKPKSELVGIDLQEKMSDQITEVAEMEKQIALINGATGMSLRAPGGNEGLGETEMGLRARVSPEQVRQVAALTPERIRQLFPEKDSAKPIRKEERAMLGQAVQEMQTAAKGAGSEEEKLLAQARVLGEHAKGNAGQWMGILHRAVGLQPQASSTAAAYTEPVSETEKLAQRHGAQLPLRQVSAQPGASREAADLVLNQVGGLEKRVDEGLVRVTQDPILSAEEKSQHRADLVRTRAELERMGQTGQLDGASRARLLQEVMSYTGTQADEKKLIGELLGGCPPDQISAMLRTFQPDPMRMRGAGETFEDLAKLAIQTRDKKAFMKIRLAMQDSGMSSPKWPNSGPDA